MKAKWTFFVLLLATVSCVELYEFEIKADTTTLVVEGFISDKSFNDTRSYPSDGRFFSVKLKKTGNVTNQHDKPVIGAIVKLVDDNGVEHNYQESIANSGYYSLNDSTFKAEEGKSYKLVIALSDGEMYESEWEEMVTTAVQPMGDISFDEVQEKAYRWKYGEQFVEEEEGINIMINLPPNTDDQTVYYRWDFTPTWIFIAPLSSVVAFDHKCWVNSNLFLKSYALKSDEVGGYRSKLVYMSLYKNDKVFEDLSLLITQQVMTERYYRFWKEMYEQSQRGGIFDAPPYNLDSNIHQVGGDGKRVSGYFGVVKEQAKRWYLNREDLSYYLEDYLYRVCNIYGLPPGPDCFSCLAYERSGGVPSVEKPSWWKD